MNTDEAIRDFTRAITLDFSYAGAYNNRGLSYYRISMFRESLADYDRAIELDPDIGVFYFNRGLAHHHRAEYEEALADYSCALALDPENTEALRNRAETFLELGEGEKARADFEAVMAVDPGNIEAYAGLAVARRKGTSKSGKGGSEGETSRREGAGSTRQLPERRRARGRPVKSPEWHEGIVDTSKAHIKIYWKENPAPVGLLAPQGRRSFVVQFLPATFLETAETASARRGVRQELDFYLVDKGEANPWAYARYHCGTCADMYSNVHWSYYPGRRQRRRRVPGAASTSPRWTAASKFTPCWVTQFLSQRYHLP